MNTIVVFLSRPLSYASATQGSEDFMTFTTLGNREPGTLTLELRNSHVCMPTFFSACDVNDPVVLNKGI